MTRLVRFFLAVITSAGHFGATFAEPANLMTDSPDQQTNQSLTTNSQNSGTAFSDEESSKSALEPSNALDSKSTGANSASRQFEPNAQQTSQSTPPYPRKGTDLETAIREKQDFMLWRRENTVNQETIILHLKPGVESRPRKLLTHAQAKAIGAVIDMDLKPTAMLGLPDWQAFTLPRKMTERAVAEDVCPKLKQHPDVEDCSQNGAGYSFSAPLDTLYTSDQWSFNLGPGSANIEAAWATTTGSADTVIAILDTGITVHEDLAPTRILPGYDFVSNPIVGNDGGGRDADPSDPGDWVTSAESNSTGPLRNCTVEDSAWHGTHIAGIIAATVNNKTGVAGIDWAAKLLPVRVLGKCGNPTGIVQDLSDAILWAAGVDIGTIAVNPNPAKVINMSLSGTGSCPAAIQAAIDQATSKGAVIVAAAGNKHISGSFWPASCQNVLTVVATDFIGKRAPFSNWGGGVGVSAPGTDIMSTVNPGTTVPVSGSAYVTQSGTSQATAHISGVAALMLAANPKLTPFEIREMIKASSKPFAQGSTIILGDCGSGSCGSGIVNAAEAVKFSKMGKAVLAHNPSQDPTTGEYNKARMQNFIFTTLPNGKVAGWGESTFGQLGNATGLRVLQPTLVPGLENVDRVFAAGTTTWAILKTGEAYAMGQAGFCPPGGPCDDENYWMSFYGGSPTAAGSRSPVRTPIFDNARKIAVNYADVWARAYAVLGNGELYAWGIDTGNLGIGSSPFQSGSVVRTPKLISGLPPIRDVIPQSSATLALDQSGTVWAWGDAPCSFYPGKIENYASSPVKISELNSVKAIAFIADGHLHDAIVLKDDGTVWQRRCYDENSYTSLPVLNQVAIDRIVAITTINNSDYAFAIRSDGSLWKWDASRSDPPVMISEEGALRFSDVTGDPTNSALLDVAFLQLADGHLSAPYQYSQSDSIYGSSKNNPEFAQYILQGSANYDLAFAGRLNTASLTLGSDTDLNVTLSSSATSASVGQNINYTVTTNNLGSWPATNSMVMIGLPNEVKLISTPIGCTSTGQLVTCSLGALAPGQSGTTIISVKALVTGIVATTAYATSSAYDYQSSNNTAGRDILITSFDNGDVPTLPEWGALALGLLLLTISCSAKIQPRRLS